MSFVRNLTLRLENDIYFKLFRPGHFLGSIQRTKRRIPDNFWKRLFWFFSPDRRRKYGYLRNLFKKNNSVSYIGVFYTEKEKELGQLKIIEWFKIFPQSFWILAKSWVDSFFWKSFFFSENKKKLKYIEEKCFMGYEELENVWKFHET